MRSSGRARLLPSCGERLGRSLALPIRSQSEGLSSPIITLRVVLRGMSPTSRFARAAGPHPGPL